MSEIGCLGDIHVSNLEVEMNAIKIADSIEFICDGTYWYVNGNVGGTGEYTSS